MQLGLSTFQCQIWIEALKLRPNSAPHLCERAYVRAQLSDTAGASSDLQQAVTLHPENWYYKSELGVKIQGNSHDALADPDLAAVLSCSSSFFYLIFVFCFVFLLNKEGMLNLYLRTKEGRELMLRNQCSVGQFRIRFQCI